MGRKKYFAALAAAGMIGAMAVGSAFNSYAADGWTKSNGHWTYIYQGKTYRLAGNQRGKILYGPFRWTYDYRI